MRQLKPRWNLFLMSIACMLIAITFGVWDIGAISFLVVIGITLFSGLVIYFAARDLKRFTYEEY